jgi:hypothetical protein
MPWQNIGDRVPRRPSQIGQADHGAMTSCTAGKLGCPVLTEKSRQEGGGVATCAGIPAPPRHLGLQGGVDRAKQPHYNCANLPSLSTISLP